jgi:MFS family permease
MPPAPPAAPARDPSKMSALELRAGVSLASIFALRMLGLFLILPVFAVHASKLEGGNNHALVGLAIGAYGLTQAILQLPFGIASDRYGRKPAIIAGLLVFAAGSFVAAFATDIYMTILGRAIQGAGAISAAVFAFAADLTRDEHRTKIMAIIGSSIGGVFALSLVAAPVLYRLIGMPGIFALTGVLAIAAIGVVGFMLPDAAQAPHAAPKAAAPVSLGEVLRNVQLLRLNFGIFVLHAVQMAMFVVVPLALVRLGLPVGQHWEVYLPVVLGSFVLMLPAVIYADRKAQAKKVFVGAIVLMLAVQIAIGAALGNLPLLVVVLLLFFASFNVLEASLPSLVSRIAPPGAKGAAIGVYNTTQSLGLFVGGAAGGLLLQHFGELAVFICGSVLSLAWLALAATMTSPPVIGNRSFRVGRVTDPDHLSRNLERIPGVREAVVLPDEGVLHLKVNLESWNEKEVRKLIGGEA